jgi:plastocyanin
MSSTRRALAVGLILAMLTSPIARAQEAGEEYIEQAEYVEYVEYVEPEAPIALEPIAEPMIEPTIATTIEPTLAPTIEPTLVPTPVPTATPVPTPTPVPAASGNIKAIVVDNRFQPNTLTITPGTTVTWLNNGTNFHTLSSSEGLFDSGAMGGGQSFSYTFQKAGTFSLICRQHVLNGMSGRITVQ